MKKLSKYLKVFFWFIYGFVFGIFLWMFFIQKLPLMPKVLHVVPLTLSSLFGVLIAVSKRCKCVSVLGLLGFFDKIGRSFLRTLVLLLILRGPIENIFINSKEVVRCVVCSSVLTYNLTAARVKFMTKPMLQALKSFEAYLPNMSLDLLKVRKELLLIDKFLGLDEEYLAWELNDNKTDSMITLTNSSDTVEMSTVGPLIEQYEIKKQVEDAMFRRCTVMMKNVKKQCYKSFSSVFLKCTKQSFLSLTQFICSAFYPPTICNAMIDNENEICKINIDPGLGDAYIKFKKLENQLFGSLSENMTVRIKEIKFNKENFTEEILSTGEDMLKEIDNKRIFVRDAYHIVKTVLAFVFLRIVWMSIKYCDNYLNDPYFDNFYVTEYFKTIDTRRRNKGKRTVLPLKPYEKRGLIDSTSIKFLGIETDKICLNMTNTIIQVLAGTIVLIVDWLLTYTLVFIKQNAKINFSQVGQIAVDAEVAGKSTLAGFIRNLLNNFEIDEHQTTFSSNEPCLPDPSFLETRKYLEIYGLYFSAFFLLFIEIYVNRLKRKVCATHFPKTEKLRILFLYNGHLMNRKNLVEVMQRKIININENEKIKIWPYIWNKIKCFELCRKKCCVCKEKIPKSEPHTICQMRNCGLIYCKFCWKDAKKKCLRCKV